MANEAKIDLETVKGSGKWDNIKRRYYEPNGFKPSPSEEKLNMA